MLELSCEESDEKALNGQYSLALWTDRHDLRSQRQHRSRMIVRRVTVGQVARQCCHVPHLRVRDHAGGIENNGILRLNEMGVFQFGFSSETTDPQKSTLFYDVGQAGDSVDVDQVARTRQPELHHG